MIHYSQSQEVQHKDEMLRAVKEKKNHYKGKSLRITTELYTDFKCQESLK